ncbi:hypothetical protein K438DRAFT_1782790 [Mycena galopus ATCC 62051]|nr:hypothetical protein K438DRAFT_1782790 [Mycena galopus ATCC 62051]
MTHDAPLSRQCTKGPRFQPGVAFRAWATLLTEGVHGSLSKQAVVVYDLRHGKEAQTYGIGIKEVWRVEDGKHVPAALRTHLLGGWEYHIADGLVSISLVVGLDYKNPCIELYRDFQRTKYHPHFRALLANGTRLAYGARALTKGGLRSLPRLHFPGGALVGVRRVLRNGTEGLLVSRSGALILARFACRASFCVGIYMRLTCCSLWHIFAFSLDCLPFPSNPVHLDRFMLANLVHAHICAAPVVNIAEIKGAHNAMRTGMLASEAALQPTARFVSTASPGTFRVGESDSAEKSHQTDAEKADAPLSLAPYTAAFPRSPVHTNLWAVRNVRPGFNTHWNLPQPLGLPRDALVTLPAASFSPIAYPPFEPPPSTDLMSSVALTGMNHAEGEEVHLRVMHDSSSRMQFDARPRTPAPQLPRGLKLMKTRRLTPTHTKIPPGGARTCTPTSGPTWGCCSARAPRACTRWLTAIHSGNSETKEEEIWEGTKLVGTSRNCIHCKLCDIKVPTQDITWPTPEGGGGPKYTLT